MATINWGLFDMTVTGIGDNASKRLTIPTPVEGSTTLSTTRGDKHEAAIEGGGNEAVRYDKGSYTLEFSVRFAAERNMPFSDVSSDGNVKGTYKIVLASKDSPNAPTMTINECVITYEDEYDVNDGARRHFYCDSLVPENGGDQIEWTDGALASTSTGGGD